MRVQKRSSRQSVSSAPKIKPKRKMRKHRWEWRGSPEHEYYECKKCRERFRLNLLSLYEANWRPPTHGCIPALKGTQS